jgi:hypothetical protein
LSKGLGGHVSNQLGSLLQVGKEYIEFGLKALAHTAQHHRYESWQRQLSLPGECFWVIRMTGLQKEFSGQHVRGEVGIDGIDGIEKHSADEKQFIDAENFHGHVKGYFFISTKFLTWVD